MAIPAAVRMTVILRVDAVPVHTYQHFRETLSPSALKAETLCFSEMLVCTYKSIRRQSPQEEHRQI
jgi:hypothetical protein